MQLLAAFVASFIAVVTGVLGPIIGRCNASNFVYWCTFLCSVVRLSCVCHICDLCL